MDLSPREVVPTATGRPRKRPWLAIGVLAGVLVAGAVVVVQFLNNAVDYYCNVDEIGVKEGCDPGRNIRIQGVVEQGTVEGDDDDVDGVRFTISYNGESIEVDSGNDPLGIFQECIPVVVRGRVIEEAGQRYFSGDEVMVMHDNQYDAAEEAEYQPGHEDRIEEAAACSRRG